MNTWTYSPSTTEETTTVPSGTGIVGPITIVGSFRYEDVPTPMSWWVPADAPPRTEPWTLRFRHAWAALRGSADECDVLP